jgi:hypothetical protein
MRGSRGDISRMFGEYESSTCLCLVARNVAVFGWGFRVGANFECAISCPVSYFLATNGLFKVDFGIDSEATRVHSFPSHR